MKNKNIDVLNKTFIKRYWVALIFLIAGLVISGIIIDVNFSSGFIESTKISVFNTSGVPTVTDSYVFKYDYPYYKAYSSFLYTLAMSLMISIFILKVIQKDDDDQRKREDDERKTELFKDVFKGVFDRLMPSEIFDVVKSDILEANIVRKKVKWTFDFIVEEDKITLFRNVMYEAHNLTSEDCTEPFSYIFSSSDYSSTEIEFLKWHDIKDRGTTQVAYNNDRGSSQLIHESLGTDVEKVTKDIEVPCDKVIFINFKSKEVYKSCTNYLHETHFTSACSIGWELQVNFPKGYEFSMIPVFSGTINTIVDNEDRKEYTYDGAILKGQGIEFILSKKPDEISDIPT